MVLLSIGLIRQNSSLERNLASLQSRFDAQSSNLQQANEIVSTLLDPEAKKIELVAAGSKPQPRGKAIYQSPQPQPDFPGQQSGSVACGQDL